MHNLHFNVTSVFSVCLRHYKFPAFHCCLQYFGRATETLLLLLYYFSHDFQIYVTDVIPHMVKS